MAKKKSYPVSFFRTLLHVAKRNSLCIVAPYYTEEKKSDGYFRRVIFSDTLLESVPRVFLDLENPSPTTHFTRIDKNKIVINFSPNKLIRRIVPFFIFLFCHRAYYESVWQVRKPFLKFPFLKNYVDVHGSVPEEEFLGKRYQSAQTYSEIEEATIHYAKHLFCVSEAMIAHFHKKYGKKVKATMSVLPIMDEQTFETENFIKKKYRQKPNIIYAGGIFEWQNIELMQKVINSQINSAKYDIYTPTPNLFWKTWKSPKNRNKITVKSAKPGYLFKNVYPGANYGFALRDDIVVNNVACPTKITEYLRFGIIPILKTPNVGDFVSLGMQYLSLENAFAGKYFNENEYHQIIDNNYEVLKKYATICKQGINEFNKIMIGKNHAK